VTGRPGMARSAGARSAPAGYCTLHLTRWRMEDAKRQAGLCISLLRRELAHAQRPKFSGGRASRAALRPSPSRSVATCPHRFCRLGCVCVCDVRCAPAAQVDGDAMPGQACMRAA
jgi:hypothetical protein